MIYFHISLVNIGSGISMIKVDGDGKFKRVSGTSIGGGTFWGLGKLLTKCKSFDALLEMSHEGNNKVIDMLVGDIYGELDYSKLLGSHIPSHEGYRNTIELLEGNNVVPLRSDTIWLVQNGCSFHGLRSEDPNQHLKDFLKLVDSLDLDVANRERTRLRLFQFSLRDQASNWLERLPAGSISTWEDLTTRFLA
ncbi:zinc finger, CCHC-type containing protein [Tanacetum coccineum]